MRKLSFLLASFTSVFLLGASAFSDEKELVKTELFKKDSFNTKSFKVSYEFLNQQYPANGAYARFTLTNISSSDVKFLIKGTSHIYSRGFGGGGGIFYKQSGVVSSGKTVKIDVYVPLTIKSYGSASLEFIDLREASNVSADDSKEHERSIRWDLWRDNKKTITVTGAESLGNDLRMLSLLKVLELEKGAWKQLSEKQRITLLTWVWIGGELAVYEEDFNDIVNKYPAFDIFERKTDNKKRKNLDISYGSGAISGNGAGHGFYAAASEREQSGSCGFSDPVPASLSLNMLMIFLLIFAVIAGPGVIIYCRVKGRPVMILILIPVISAIACILLCATAVFVDGIRAKKVIKSIVYIDQKNNTAVSVQITGILKSALPFWEPIEIPEAYICRTFSVSQSSAVVQYGSEYYLEDCLVSRNTSHIMTAALHDNTQKLVVDESENSLKVTNNFKGGIKKVLLRNSSGKYKYYEGNIAPGASAELKDIETLPDIFYVPMYAPADALNGNFGKGKPFGDKTDLAKNTYIIEFDKSPFRIETIKGGVELLDKSFDFAVGKYEGTK